MNGVMGNDTQFFDPDERFGQKLDFNTILMRQIDKVRTAGSVEWMGGYWERKPFVMAGMSAMATNVYIPDTREVYINSVKVLYDLLLPYFDDDFNQDYEKLVEQKEKRFKQYKERLQKSIEDAKKETHNVDDEVRAFKDQHSQVQLEYDLEHHRRLFHKLLLMINRKGLIDNPGVREIA